MTGESTLDPSLNLERLLEEHVASFLERFGPGRAPRVFFAPGRVNLFGAHLDYNGGPVMPTAIDRGTFIAVRERAGDELSLASTLDRSGLESSLARLPEVPVGRWVDYPIGVLRSLVGRGANTGVEILFGGNLAVGAGLSSSASMCVATAFAVNAVWRLGLELSELVNVALEAERDFVGVKCGIMDPYAVGLARPGHLLWLDCRDVRYEHLPFDFERVSIGVADTGVRRQLAQGEFNRRVEECRAAFEALRAFVPGAVCLRDIPRSVLDEHADALSSVQEKRARHVVNEVERAFEARRALLGGDIPRMGGLMTETHRSLRDLFEVSCPELDELIESAIEVPGVYGGRLTGAGFGGCVVLLVERAAHGDLRDHVSARFEHKFGRRPVIALYGGDEGPREIP